MSVALGLPDDGVASRLGGVLAQIAIELSNLLPFRYFSGPRQALWRLAGVRFSGPACVFGKQTISYPSLLEIGRGTFVNAHCIFENDAKISIGGACHIGPRCTFVTTNHEGAGRARVVAGIVIEDNVWLGAGTIVLPGIRIGRGAVVGAGAVVTRDVENGATVAGVPARSIRPA